MTSGTGMIEVVALLAFGLILCLSALRKKLPDLPIWRSRSTGDACRPRVRFAPLDSSLAPTGGRPTSACGGSFGPDTGPEEGGPDGRFDDASSDAIPLAQALVRGGKAAAVADPREAASPALAEAGKVLLVDAREGFRTGMLLRLARSGYRVFPVARSRDALDVFTREKADLVQIHRDALIELGGEFVRRLRASSPYVPILVHGGHPGSGDVGRLKHGVDITVVASAGDDTRVLATMIDCCLGAAHSEQQTREVIEARGRIIADLCYDVRSALEVISGYTDILRDTPDFNLHRETLDRMRASTSSATHHLQGCAAWAPAPLEPARIERVELAELSQEIRRLAGHAIGDQPLRLTTTGPVYGSALFTDGEKLVGILSSVVAEAVRHSPTKAINIAVRSHPDRTDFVVTGIEPHFTASAGAPFAAVDRVVGAGDRSCGVGLEREIAMRWGQSIGATISGAAGPSGRMACTVSVPARLLTCGSNPATPTLH